MTSKIFVNGTFDVLHLGHLELLNYAKSLGDYLLVALDTDSRIKQKKGYARPINDLTTRMAIMNNLKAVDEVSSFATDSELSSIIKSYAPDIMIVGSDWKDKPIIGSQYAEELVFFDRVSNFSTTNTIDSYVNKLKRE